MVLLFFITPKSKTLEKVEPIKGYASWAHFLGSCYIQYQALVGAQNSKKVSFAQGPIFPKNGTASDQQKIFSITLLHVSTYSHYDGHFSNYRWRPAGCSVRHFI